MLIIPAIYIKHSLCVHEVRGEKDTDHFYGMDPIRRVQIWRGENAKALHVIDLDGAMEGMRKNVDVVRRMVDCVDIPLQLGGGFRTYESVREMLEYAGVYRIIIGTLAVENPDLVEKLIADFSPRKIVVSIDVKDGSVYTRGRLKSFNRSATDVALEMKKRGVERILFLDMNHQDAQLGPPIEDLKRLADETDLCITLNGTIRNYLDLRQVEALQNYKVDSVVLSDVLYQNVFPCQKIWRHAEKQLMLKEEHDAQPQK